jgi:hypothetical protein
MRDRKSEIVFCFYMGFLTIMLYLLDKESYLRMDVRHR